jgi:hypothetical protein
VLSKGLNFAFIPSKVPAFDILKSIESSTVPLAPEKITEFNVQIKRAIENHKIQDRNLTHDEPIALSEIKKYCNFKIR